MHYASRCLVKNATACSCVSWKAFLVGSCVSAGRHAYPCVVSADQSPHEDAG